MFGWLVVIGLVGWVGLVRLGWSCQVGHVRLVGSGWVGFVGLVLALSWFGRVVLVLVGSGWLGRVG